MKTLTIWNSGNHSFTEALQDHALYSCTLPDHITDEDITNIIHTINMCNGTCDTSFLVNTQPEESFNGARRFETYEQAYASYTSVYGANGVEALRNALLGGRVTIK